MLNFGMPINYAVSSTREQHRGFLTDYCPLSTPVFYIFTLYSIHFLYTNTGGACVHIIHMVVCGIRFPYRNIHTFVLRNVHLKVMHLPCTAK